jgi:hypothetical protein
MQRGNDGWEYVFFLVAAWGLLSGLFGLGRKKK